MQPLTPEDIERFWSFVNKTDDCWEWTGGLNHGQGIFCYGPKRYKKQVHAHRVAYSLHEGDPGNFECIQTCKNRKCVNIEHLALKRKHQKKTKMTWETARQIRKVYAETNLTTRAIGQMFGYEGIYPICKNKIWHDPNYHPPERIKTRCPKRVQIFGEDKSPREWAKDPRCHITYSTLIKRVRHGMQGPNLLLRKSTKGRPRKEVTT